MSKGEEMLAVRAGAANSDSVPPTWSRSPRPARPPAPTASSPARAATRSPSADAARSMPTFAEAARSVVEQKRPGRRDDHQPRAWLNSLERYAFPRIGGVTVSEVNSADVLEILTPIWHTKMVTARRCADASARCWSGHRHELPGRQSLRPDRGGTRPSAAHRRAHAGAAPPEGGGGDRGGSVLGEVAGPQPRVRVSGSHRRAMGRGPRRRLGGARPVWPGVDRPGEAHEDEARAPGAPVRPGHRGPRRGADAARRRGVVFTARSGQPLHDKSLRRLLQEHGVAAVPHGFRSSFRDWAAEETDHQREVIKAALAHVVGNKVEAAYARSDLFERRRRLMDDWEAYLAAGERRPEDSTPR